MGVVNISNKLKKKSTKKFGLIDLLKKKIDWKIWPNWFVKKKKKKNPTKKFGQIY